MRAEIWPRSNACFGGSGALFYPQQLHFEHEGGVRADGSACALCAVGQLGGDVEFPLGADGHELQGFHPAGDDLRDTEGGGRSAPHGAVEHRAVDERAVVVHLHGVRGFGLRAGAFAHYFVLQPAGQGDHFGAPGVGGEERLSFLAVLLPRLVLQCPEKVVDDRLGFLVGDFRLAVFHHVLYALGQPGVVQRCDAALQQVVAEAHPQRVTHFVHVFLFFFKPEWSADRFGLNAKSVFGRAKIVHNGELWGVGVLKNSKGGEGERTFHMVVNV